MPCNASPPSGEAAAPFHLALANRRDALEPARQAVLGHLAPWSLSPRAIYAIELILEETLMNVITHGFRKSSAQHLIDLRVQVRPDAVVLQFEDDGMPFDPTQFPEPATPASIEQAVPGGRGVLLVRRFASAVRYHRSHARNQLTIEIVRDAS
jgi:anti-sigma regulatory factor (Ser/Thr protein kinase)